MESTHRGWGPPLRAVFPDYRGRERSTRSWLSRFRRRSFPSAKGAATLRGGCTTTASFQRYAPPVDQSSATLGNPRPSDASIGRIRTKANAIKRDAPWPPRVKERRGHKSRVHLVHPPRPPRPRDKETLRFLVHPRLRRFAIFWFRSVWREESLFWTGRWMDG